MQKDKVPTEGPMVPANTAKLMKEGYRQRAAVNIAGLRDKGSSK